MLSYSYRFHWRAQELLYCFVCTLQLRLNFAYNPSFRPFQCQGIATSQTYDDRRLPVEDRIHLLHLSL